MPTFPIRNPLRPSRPVAPPTRRPLISPTAWASTRERFNTVIAPIAPIIKEAIKNKQVDDMEKLLFTEKKEGTPGPPPKIEEDEHSTTSYSLLEGLEPEHLPWSKEVHLIEHVNGVRKTYAAVVVVLREIESTEIEEQDDSAHGLEHAANAGSVTESAAPSAHPVPPPPPREPEAPKWGTPLKEGDAPRPPRPF